MDWPQKQGDVKWYFWVDEGIVELLTPEVADASFASSEIEVVTCLLQKLPGAFLKKILKSSVWPFPVSVLVVDLLLLVTKFTESEKGLLPYNMLDHSWSREYTVINERYCWSRYLSFCSVKLWEIIYRQ